MKLNTEDPCPLPDVELKFDGFSLDGVSNCTVDGSSLVFNSLDLNYVNKFDEPGTQISQERLVAPVTIYCLKIYVVHKIQMINHF